MEAPLSQMTHLVFLFTSLDRGGLPQPLPTPQPVASGEGREQQWEAISAEAPMTKPELAQRPRWNLQTHLCY